jgi:hypothetical protein
MIPEISANEKTFYTICRFSERGKKKPALCEKCKKIGKGNGAG